MYCCMFFLEGRGYGMKDVENSYLFCWKFTQRGTVSFVEDLYCNVLYIYFYLKQMRGLVCAVFSQEEVESWKLPVLRIRK